MRVLDEVWYNLKREGKVVGWLLPGDGRLYVDFDEENTTEEEMMEYADKMCEKYEHLDYEIVETSVAFFEHDPLNDIYSL
jgi:predicted ATPase